MDQSQSSSQGAPTKATTRKAAMKVADELVKAGHIAYFAGGCVRDRLMGNEPVDYDIATDARPEEVAMLFRKVQRVGESFGVMLVRLMGHTIEVATFRSDGVYSDGRHPDEVTFSDAEHDALRRDFTINGLFEEPRTGEIIDHVGGQADLETGIIRAIGDPQARLREDRLRMLRAVRFAARFGFAIDEQTIDAIRKNAGQLEGVSRERIGQEIRKMMSDAGRVIAVKTLQDLGLDGIILLENGRDEESLRIAGLVEGALFSTVLGAWLLDRHAGRGEDHAEIAERWGRALMLSNEVLWGLKGCLEVYGTLKEGWRTLGIAGRKHLAVSKWFGAGVELLEAEDAGQSSTIRHQVAELAADGLAPEPFLDGYDLLKTGISPGPSFGKLLEAVYDAQLEGAIQTKEEALALVARLWSGLNNDEGMVPD